MKTDLETIARQYEAIPALADLSVRHRLFVVAYCAGPTKGNAAASYRAAGYPPRDSNKAAASSLRSKPKIRAALQALAAATARRPAKTLRRLPLTHEERLVICADIARAPGVPPRARLAAIRLDAELRGAFKAEVEDVDIIIDLVVPREPPPSAEPSPPVKVLELPTGREQ